MTSTEIQVDDELHGDLSGGPVRWGFKLKMTWMATKSTVVEVSFQINDKWNGIDWKSWFSD